MIKNCSKVYHNVKTAIPDYTNLEGFQKAAYNGGVLDFSLYTHEARWVKSSAELNLMRESAAIGCQVCQSCTILFFFTISSLLRNFFWYYTEEYYFNECNYD